MGAIVFQAGDKRQIGSFSTLMLHSPQWFLSGSDQQIFTDYATLAKHYKSLVSEIFAQRSGTHDATWWEDFIYSGRDRFLNAQECIALGLADEIYGLDLTTPPPIDNADTDNTPDPDDMADVAAPSASPS
jgi:ATP-dependent protease ClpP protease subunit